MQNAGTVEQETLGGNLLHRPGAWDRSGEPDGSITRT